MAGLGMALHDRLHTWSERVSVYIALTRSAADKLGSYRIPRNRYVKPNSVVDPSQPQFEERHPMYKIQCQDVLSAVVSALAGAQSNSHGATRYLCNRYGCGVRNRCRRKDQL
jgi:hypothetical protein